MSWLTTVTNRLRALFRKDQLDDELDDELRFHLDMETEDLVRRGLTEEAARRTARIRLGDAHRIKEAHRDARGVPAVESLAQDLQFALRGLGRRPGFVVAATLSLALGIGANTAIFSIINAVILQPMPYPRPDRLVNVWETMTWQGSATWGSVSVPNLEDWRAQNTVFEAMGAFQVTGGNLTSPEGTVRVAGTTVESDVFRVLGVEPLAGRVFTREENQFGSHRVVVLGYGLWQSQFAGDPALVGQNVTLNGASFTVVGVMPPDFEFPPRAGIQLYVPLALRPGESWQRERGSHWLNAVARLRDGVTFIGAQQQMREIAARLEKEYPDNATRSVLLRPFHLETVGGIASPLLVLTVAVGLVMLLACANVAHMTLARAVTRRRELAVRLALGASRLRLMRLLIVESLVLAVGGGLVGLLAARLCLDALSALPSNPLPPDVPITIDATVLGYCVLASIVAAVLSGLLPSLRVRRIDLQTGLKEGDAVFGARVASRRGVLMSAEVALAVVLAIGAILLLTSLRRLTTLDLGFSPEHVLTMRVTLPEERYDARTNVPQAWTEILTRVRAIPGVEHAGLNNILPIQSTYSNMSITIPGRPEDRQGHGPSAEHRVVSADYFRAMGIPLVAGRFITERDGPDAQNVVLLNQQCADRYWPGQDPVGQRLGFGGKPSADGWATIVGVVGNVRNRGVNRSLQNVIYVPYTQIGGLGWKTMSLVVRTAGEPSAAAGLVRDAVRAADKDATTHVVMTMEQVIERSVMATRFLSWLLTIFCALALALAVVGVYGVMAHLVARRTHEIGVRMALGASRGAVALMVLKQGLRQTGAGVLAGLALAVIFSLAMRRFVIGVSAIDVATYATAVALILGVALAACYVPARRAARVDPLAALREE
jgi:putative ABC transport system permease protein